jgi:hypothetical protein
MVEPSECCCFSNYRCFHPKQVYLRVWKHSRHISFSRTYFDVVNTYIWCRFSSALARFSCFNNFRCCNVFHFVRAFVWNPLNQDERQKPKGKNAPNKSMDVRRKQRLSYHVVLLLLACVLPVPAHVNAAVILLRELERKSLII